MIGTKFYKDDSLDWREYEECAAWCNSNSAHIDDMGEYYEVVANPAPTKADLAESRINELKALLAGTDYVAIKLAEGVATKEEYAGVLADRQEWRAEINELNGALNTEE